jgi:hypothetical protein
VGDDLDRIPTLSDADNYSWQGTQDQGTTVHEYNTRDHHVHAAIALVRTAQPVKIVRAPYDVNGNDISPGTAGAIGYVDVQPLVNQVDGYGRSTPHGTIYRIPYHRYQGANGAVISDPVKDDIGEIVAHDRDTSIVRATNKQANPGSRRRHDFADSVYRGQQQAGAPTQYLTFTSDGITITDKNANTIVMGSSGVTITDKNKNKIVMDSSGITITSLDGNGPITLKGNGQTNVANTHHHPQANDSHGDVEPDTGAPVPGT